MDTCLSRRTDKRLSQTSLIKATGLLSWIIDNKCINTATGIRKPGTSMFENSPIPGLPNVVVEPQKTGMK